VAASHEVAVESVEEGLFSDLRGAALLTEVPPLGPETLVDQYELAQIQGVLLRAVQLHVSVECGSSDAARRLFQKLKFRQLLYRMQQSAPGVYEIEIEGPFSLFESVTKYGLQLALLIPALLECKRAELEAKVRWGKDRRDLVFRSKLDCRGGSERGPTELRTDVETLLGQLQKKKSDFSVAPAKEILDVPGEGLCVPDLKVEAPGRPPVYLEVMGFWSRDAVFRRVEWAESQKDVRVLFAVSSRLRVKKEVLDADSGSALYVYKGTMNAASVLAQVAELSS
jgi:predicted nuclease of restriction endonuclease-like RecB superfamily